MFNICQDAMIICKKFGYYDLFVKIKCNSNCSEIQDFLKQINKEIIVCDGLDIVCCVFKMKLDQFMANFKKALFGIWKS